VIRNKFQEHPQSLLEQPLELGFFLSLRRLGNTYFESK